MAPLPFQPVQSGAHAGTPPSPAGLIGREDQRWILAARAAMLANPRTGLSAECRARLLGSATARGFPPIHAETIVGIAERAAARGGLDHTAAHELAEIPAAVPPRPANRWPVLIAVNLALLAVVAVLVLERL